MNSRILIKYFLGPIISDLNLTIVTTAAGEVNVINVTALQHENGTWTISATLQHNDASWSHYANRWDVVDSDGNLFGSRELLHPHVEEQPFTRSLSAIKIPENLDEVMILANDSKHGTGGKTFILKLLRK